MIAHGSKLVADTKHNYFTKIRCILSEPIFATKAEIFNNNFCLQCTPLDTGSEISSDLYVIASLLQDHVMSDEEIIRITRTFYPNKAYGWNEIQM